MPCFLQSNISQPGLSASHGLHALAILTHTPFTKSHGANPLCATDGFLLVFQYHRSTVLARPLPVGLTLPLSPDSSPGPVGAFLKGNYPMQNTHGTAEPCGRSPVEPVVNGITICRRQTGKTIAKARSHPQFVAGDGVLVRRTQNTVLAYVVFWAGTRENAVLGVGHPWHVAVWILGAKNKANSRLSGRREGCGICRRTADIPSLPGADVRRLRARSAGDTIPGNGLVRGRAGKSGHYPWEHRSCDRDISSRRGWRRCAC
jgi:hypothetical protein